VTRVAAAALTAAALLAAAIFTTASGDDEFLAALADHGIAYTSRADALAAAHLVCARIAAGEKPSQVAADVSSDSNLSSYAAGFFVGASIGAFCPQSWGGPG
jgi:Protein of unknown function (DUF732)